MKVLIKNQDGSVGIMHPILDCGLTLEQIIAKDVPKGVPYEIVDDSAIPSDRSFRDAWKHDLTVDIPKAQEITKDRLRVERAPLLNDLDIMQLKEVAKQATMPEPNNTRLIEIESQKQILRDCTKKVDLCKTVEELKAVTL